MLGRTQPEWLAAPLGLDRQRLQHLSDLAHPQTAVKRHRAEMVAMQPTGEFGEEGVLGVGGNTFDDELLSGDAEGDGGAAFEEMLGATHDAAGGGGQRRMPLRVHRVLVEGDREFDQEVRQLSREGGLFRRGSHGPPK